MSAPERRPWLKGKDGLFHPTPPYRVGEVVLCDAFHAVRIDEGMERWQEVRCRRCEKIEDDYVMSQAEGN